MKPNKKKNVQSLSFLYFHLLGSFTNVLGLYTESLE